MNLSESINDYLEKNEMTAKTLATLSGVSESSIYKCRWGENCREDIKEKVAKVIGYVEEEPEPEFEPEIEYVPLEEAAARMGITEYRLKFILQSGKVPFGFAYLGRGEEYNYIMFRTDFEKFIEEHKKVSRKTETSR